MEDYKLRDLRASHTLGWLFKGGFIFSTFFLFFPSSFLELFWETMFEVFNFLSLLLSLSLSLTRPLSLSLSLSLSLYLKTRKKHICIDWETETSVRDVLWEMLGERGEENSGWMKEAERHEQHYPNICVFLYDKTLSKHDTQQSRTICTQVLSYFQVKKSFGGPATCEEAPAAQVCVHGSCALDFAKVLLPIVFKPPECEGTDEEPWHRARIGSAAPAPPWVTHTSGEKRYMNNVYVIYMYNSIVIHLHDACECSHRHP